MIYICSITLYSIHNTSTHPITSIPITSLIPSDRGAKPMQGPGPQHEGNR